MVRAWWEDPGEWCRLAYRDGVTRSAEPYRSRTPKGRNTVTETIAEGLSAVGLVAGFPLLLLAFMIALERLESWGLADELPEDLLPEANDTVEAAVEELEQLSAGAQELDTESASAGRSSP